MSESEQDQFLAACQVLGQKFLRARPTLPASVADATVSLTEYRSGFRLPLYSCPFRGCRFCTDARAAFLRHVGDRSTCHDLEYTTALSDHSSVSCSQVAEVLPDLQWAGKLDYLYGAMSFLERSQVPATGLCVDRRTLRALCQRYNDQTIRCLVCFVCGQQRTTCHGPEYPNFSAGVQEPWDRHAEIKEVSVHFSRSSNGACREVCSTIVVMFYGASGTLGEPLTTPAFGRIVPMKFRHCWEMQSVRFGRSDL